MSLRGCGISEDRQHDYSAHVPKLLRQPSLACRSNYPPFLRCSLSIHPTDTKTMNMTSFNTKNSSGWRSGDMSTYLNIRPPNLIFFIVKVLTTKFCEAQWNLTSVDVNHPIHEYKLFVCLFLHYKFDLMVHRKYLVNITASE